MTILKQQGQGGLRERWQGREKTELMRYKDLTSLAKKKKSSVSKVIFKLSEMKQRHGSCF